MTRRRETKLSSFGGEAESQPAPEAEPPALSVTTLVGLVERTLKDDGRFADVWVRGEVSG
ncbi:MAG: hypothetical protein QOE90_2518, partial [Thermoplasmata archaeon]|nr:hypothetical protein [Thermoplasmata archaeon]